MTSPSLVSLPYRRRQILALAGAMGGALILPAHAQESKREDTFTVGFFETPRHLNGAVQSGVATALPSTQLFASPLRYDDQWRPQPYLAESWEMAADGRSLTLHLRKGALFHDGKPITSADVAFSVMAIKANHPFQTMLAPVERVDTPDAHTAIIRTSTPHPALLLAMSPALCPILPKHIYDDGQDLKSHPRNSRDVIGSGPFRLVEFSPGQRIVMERFDGYFLEGKPYLERVVISLNTAITSLQLAFEQGDMHVLPFITPPAILKRLQSRKGVTLSSKGYEGIGPLNWLAFNCARKPFDDARVRHAIAMVIDKKFVTKALMGGFAEQSDSPIAPSSPFYAPDAIAKYPFDLERAAALLDEAGYPKGSSGTRFSMSVDYAPGSLDQRKSVAEYIRGQLRKVGINADVRASADFPSWAKRMAEHDFDVTMDNVFNWGDPVIGVARTYLSSNIKPIVWTNTQSYSNPRVDTLLETAAIDPDADNRKEQYREFQELVTKDLPIAYVNVIPYHTASQASVVNLPQSIWGMMSPWDEVKLT